MEKTLRGKIIKLYDEDEDLLEDAIIENKQAIEMSKIYSDILNDIKSNEIKKLYVEFIEMRKQIGKPITKRGLKMLVGRCERLSNFNIKEQKIMLEASIVNNWSSVYIPNEIKQDREELKQRHIEELKNFYGVADNDR